MRFSKDLLARRVPSRLLAFLPLVTLAACAVGVDAPAPPANAAGRGQETEAPIDGADVRADEQAPAAEPAVAQRDLDESNEVDDAKRRDLSSDLARVDTTVNVPADTRVLAAALPVVRTSTAFPPFSTSFLGTDALATSAGVLSSELQVNSPHHSIDRASVSGIVRVEARVSPIVSFRAPALVDIAQSSVFVPFPSWGETAADLTLNVVNSTGTQRCTSTIRLTGTSGALGLHTNLGQLGVRTLECAITQTETTAQTYTMTVTLLPSGNALPLVQTNLSVRARVQHLEATFKKEPGFMRSFNGKCADIDGITSANGARAQVWDCWGGDNQLWVTTRSGQIRGIDNKCLEARGTPWPGVGTPLQIFDCLGTNANQQWVVLGNGQIRGIGGLCIDVANPDAPNGAGLVLATCNSTPSQRWLMP